MFVLAVVTRANKVERLGLLRFLALFSAVAVLFTTS